jgi:hypothetical protein
MISGVHSKPRNWSTKGTHRKEAAQIVAIPPVSVGIAPVRFAFILVNVSRHGPTEQEQLANQISLFILASME